MAPGAHPVGESIEASDTPPNKITKEKIWHLRQVKAERRISLHRTAGQTSLTTRSSWKTAPPQYNTQGGRTVGSE